jgi:ElaB/YqjD/DUF883 family membrane-anchored ribosome-binding protein
MNAPDPFSPLNPGFPPPASQQPTPPHTVMETAREKLAEAGDIARKKMESAKETASETMHMAREKVESAGSSLLQWTRENPATALATMFASGFVIGCAFALGRHEKTFGQRLSEHPMDTLREAVYSALAPIGEKLHEAADSARAAGGKAAKNGHAWADRIRDAGDNLKFW